MVQAAQVGRGGSVDYVSIGEFPFSIACKYARAAWKSHAPHVLKKRIDPISYGGKGSVVGSRADSLNAHQDMCKEPGFILCGGIRPAYPCVERKWWNRA